MHHSLLDANKQDNKRQNWKCRKRHVSDKQLQHLLPHQFQNNDVLQISSTLFKEEIHFFHLFLASTDKASSQSTREFETFCRISLAPRINGEVIPKRSKWLAICQEVDASPNQGMVWNGKWNRMERKSRYGIWNMPEWNGIEDLKNRMEDNLPFFHINSILYFVHCIYRKT